MTAADIGVTVMSVTDIERHIMEYFVTGASGWIGTAVTAELLQHGHEVVGLARNDESAAKLSAAGAHVFRGSIDDADGLRAPAEAADGVIHLAFNHDFSAHAAAAEADRAVITALGETLAGSDRPLIVPSGVLGLGNGVDVATERTEFDLAKTASPRLPNGKLALDFADRGVRVVSVRFAPTVHGDGDHGFMAGYVAMDRLAGVAGFMGDGSQTWPAVHVADAAVLVRLALEKAPAGSVLHAVADEGVEHRAIADVMGEKLGLPVRAFEPDEIPEQWAWLARFLGFGSRASSTATQELLGWTPTHNTLLEDLAAGYYTER
ncbi:MAG: SDR family oxidoreductase [Rhodoglobus sp.]